MPSRPLPDPFLEKLGQRYRAINGVEGVFLMGSAALGELIWLENTLLSDVEFGVVVARLDPKTRRAARALGYELQQTWGYELEPALVTRTRLEHGAPKNLSFRPHTPNQLMFDIQNSARWLVSPETPITQPNWKAEELPVWEAIRLILNRFGEWTDALADREKVNSAEISRCRDKFLVALGDANLIAEKRYVPGYRARHALFEAHFEDGLIKPWISAAYRARINGVVADLDVPMASILVAGITQISQFIHQPTNVRTAPDLIGWARTQRTRVPVRHQASYSVLDNFFDSIFTMAAARFHRSGWPSLLQALAFNIPLFLIFYQKLVDLLYNMATRPSGTVTSAEIKDIHDFWTRFCK